MNPPRDGLSRFASVALLGLIGVELACWLPGYLARPLFADHDVFATMAQGWDAGLKPYRDLISNNFPGTIYLFWGLGKLFGWGNVPALYAADAALLLAVIVSLIGWSLARFGRALPGAVGAAAVATYYLNLDFSQSAQRDWHAAAFVVLGLLAAQARPGRVGWWLSALGFALGMIVRPQVVLFVPALLMAATAKGRLAGASGRATLGSGAAWLGVAGVAVALGFAPLVRAGVLGDFLEGLRALAFGGSYNKKPLIGIVLMLADEAKNLPIMIGVAVVAVLAIASPEPAGRSTARVWLAAVLGALLYAPLSPSGQPYLYHPLWLVWSISLAAAVGLVFEGDAPPRGLLFALVTIHLAAIAWPRFAEPRRVREAVAALRGDLDPRPEASGYQTAYGPRLVLPPWADYRDTLAYLRARTSPSTRVANLLKGVAITGPAARLPALPAESATWVFVVKPEDEGRFAREMEKHEDAVVVLWSGGEVGRFDHPLPELAEVVRRLYQFEARFGTLEVWRRRPAGQPPATASTPLEGTGVGAGSGGSAEGVASATATD
jgi:hypothetical protein